MSESRTGYRHGLRSPGDLTRRQREVLALIAAGKTNAEIGDALGITLDGAKWHVSEILGVLAVDSREEAAEWWKREHRPATRLRRAVVGLGAAGALKWSAAAVAIGVFVGALLLAVALSGDPEPSPPALDDPTEAPTTISTPDDPTTAPRPSATPDPTIPPPRLADGASDPVALAEARLVVYADEIGGVAGPSDRLYPIVEIVSYDPDSAQIVGAFRFDTSPPEHTGLHYLRLAGRTVIASFETRVVAANLDGSNQRTLFTPPEGAIVTSLAVSHDNRFVALGLEGADLVDPTNAYLAVVEIASGIETARLAPATQGTNAPPTAAVFGTPPGVVAWHESNLAIEVIPVRHKGGSPPTATVWLDGRIEFGDTRLRAIDESGRFAAYTTPFDVMACAGLIPSTVTLTITDLTAGDTLDEISLPDAVMVAMGWSPNGREALLAAYPIHGGGGTQPCFGSGSQPTFWIWADGVRTSVPNIESVLRRWHGDLYIERECAGEPQKLAAAGQYEHLQCSSYATPDPMTLLIGGNPFDTVRNARILGIIPAAP